MVEGKYVDSFKIGTNIDINKKEIRENSIFVRLRSSTQLTNGTASAITNNVSATISSSDSDKLVITFS